MALQVRAIKTKIKSIGNIKKITKTMEMVSVSKMKRSVERAQASKEFAFRALELLANISLERNISHSLIDVKNGNKVLMLIMGSNKGLCGGYNVNINKAVAQYMRRHPDIHVEALCIGKQAEKIARRQGITIKASFVNFSDYTQAEDVKAVVDVLIKEYMSNSEYRSAVVVYTSFLKQLQYKAMVRKFLPLDPSIIRDVLTDHDTPPKDPKSMSLYLFEPDVEAVIEKIVPLLCTAVIYQVMLEAQASEHSSRMAAMRNATDNAGNLQDSLTLEFNKARQANITQEISEIVAGAEGV